MESEERVAWNQSAGEGQDTAREDGRRRRPAGHLSNDGAPVAVL